MDLCDGCLRICVRLVRRANESLAEKQVRDLILLLCTIGYVKLSQLQLMLVGA